MAIGELVDLDANRVDELSARLNAAVADAKAWMTKYHIEAEEAKALAAQVKNLTQASYIANNRVDLLLNILARTVDRSGY